MELANFIITEETSVFDATAVIDKNVRKIAFVCDGSKLLAALTDGDIRRFIIQGGDFSRPVKEIANYQVRSLPMDRQTQAQALMRQYGLSAIPVINKQGELQSIKFADQSEVRREVNLNIPVVIMAGGKGTRLAPYTDVLPKPLIPIGDQTITEHIMGNFTRYGCNDFTLIVNYKKGLIKAYFNEIALPYTLYFVEEETYQGTGGGLGLLTGLMRGPFFMTNCDILIDADYQDILRHHVEHMNIITMVCALKKVSVPYGTVHLAEDGTPQKLVEKPEYPLLTNTGFYVIDPSFLERIPMGEFIHVTDLIQQCIDAGENVGVYPIGENGFMDMGQMAELEKMQQQLS